MQSIPAQSALMGQLLLYFFDLMSFKRSPADAPYSAAILSLFIILDLALQAIASYGFGTTSSIASALIVDAAFILGLSGIFAVRNTLPRLLQTLVAYFGANFGLSLIAFILALLFHAAKAPKTGPIAIFFVLSTVFLVVWHTAILTHLLRAAANWLLIQALAAALALTIIMISLGQWLQTTPPQ